MAAIREAGPINDNTYLIDAIHAGISGGYAVYLLKSKTGGTCLKDDEAKDFPDETLSMYRKWMEFFDENKERIDDIPHLSDLMYSRIYPLAPEKFKPLLLPGLEDAVGLAVRTYKANQV
jgi:hypothetical protein